MKDACKWLQEQGLTRAKHASAVSGKICLVAKGIRGIAFRYSWDYDTSEDDSAEGGWFDIHPDLVGGVSGYKITQFGKVCNTLGHVFNGNSCGYVRFMIHPKRYLQHVLVAKAFLPKNTDTSQTYVNHKNGNKTDNHFSTLEWVTPRESTLHAHSTGLMSKQRRMGLYDTL